MTCTLMTCADHRPTVFSAPGDSRQTVCRRLVGHVIRTTRRGESSQRRRRRQQWRKVILLCIRVVSQPAGDATRRKWKTVAGWWVRGWCGWSWDKGLRKGKLYHCHPPTASAIAAASATPTGFLEFNYLGTKYMYKYFSRTHIHIHSYKHTHTYILLRPPATRSVHYVMSSSVSSLPNNYQLTVVLRWSSARMDIRRINSTLAP